MNNWRHVHRLTPLLKFWTVILAVLAVVVVNVNVAVLTRAWAWLEQGQFLPLLGLAGAFVLACALVWFASQVWWQAMGFRLDAEEVSLRQGVFNKALRTARYDRIQAVDVVESVVARVFGLASVRVETAGGGDSVIEIAYLPRAEAEAVRREVLARARTTPAPGADHPEQGRVIVPEIPVARSLAAAALQGSSLGGVLAVFSVLLSPLSWATLVPVLLGFVPVIWNQIDRAWRFTARLDDDTLHLSYGLADRRKQSIPLERIHGVRLVQPALWRATGWWFVSVSVAGYGATSGRNSATTTLLPVGSREQADALLAVIAPAPLVDAPTYTSPARARWVSPIDLRQQSVTVRDDAVITRKGRLSTRIAVIHPSHIQELSLTRGPLQQLLGLCTVRFDLVPGPVRMAGEDLTPEDGNALLNQLRRRALPAYTPPGKPS
ncbi:membrane protein [Corynebacterium humireducens NBRC 106098 = DSM 45392]|uniref:Membrane protein n=1 Tax=Corynebacterium humireducens NBRC 106098 = DSM 45392 TaxID=1223515 RepID=A0A0B5D9D7_9CORY|nr:PH domain-containing protein [Corynebacterium humireducens]AJE32324.1 membrane protein [Corynebacterium humireducens NBRC 106098 = DSM 45392]